SDDDLDGSETYKPSAFFAAIRAADMWRDATMPVALKTGDVKLDAAAPVVPKRTGDMSRLVDLLRLRLAQSDTEVTMTREELELLIDLLSRHDLKQKAGGRPVPAYRQASWAELKLETAAEWVQHYQSTGLKFEDAIDHVANEDKIANVTAKALKLYIRGRLHS